MKEFIEKLEKDVELLSERTVIAAKDGGDARAYAEAALLITKVYSIMLAVEQTRAMNKPFSIKKENIDGGPTKN